jgi:type I restriction enzyme M protein
MLDNETKRRIDTARNILVGKLPDPKSQVEQITIALIYKFMDDMDTQSVEYGGKPSFFVGDYERFGWRKIFSPSIGGFEMLNLYGEAITSLNQNPHLPQLFRDVFKNAFLPYRDPETLKLFLKTINEFQYDHSERLGDAFEYLLSVLGSQGDAGQFRTPRHIIDFIVEVVQPKKNETVCDPACGTAGFLISSYKHILRANTRQTLGDMLTPDERKRLMTNFVGYDISPDMVRLSLVNLYLHGFPAPHIYEYDTLTSEERWNESFDVVMANPPFMSPKGGIKPHKRFSLQANRSEVLFVDYIAEHINPVSGRAGVIVPEGIIFQGTNAYKDLRKVLVEKAFLYAVVSLPAGVFQPYSGVKTSILFFDKTLGAKSDRVLFVKISNDGFGLGAQRKELNTSDLPDALNVILDYQQAILRGDTSRFTEIDLPLQASAVEKSRIAANSEYNLSASRYKPLSPSERNRWELVKLGDICQIERGGSPRPIDDYFTTDSDGINWIKIGDVGENEKYITSTRQKIKRTGLSKTRVVQNGDFILSNSMSFGRPYIVKITGAIHDGWLQLRIIDSSLVDPDFLYYVLRSDAVVRQYALLATGGVVNNLNSKLVSGVSIPLPPLSVQKEIVERVESYQRLIDGAKQVVQSFRPNIQSNPDWQTIELGEVGELKNGINYTKESIGESVHVLGVKDFHSNLYAPLDSFASVRIDGELSDDYRLKENDIVFVRSNGNQDLIGRSVIIPKLDFKTTFSGFTIRLRLTSPQVFPLFYAHLLKTESVRRKLVDSGTGANIKSLNQTSLRQLVLPLPPLEEQKQIVAQIEREQSLVNANRELIGIYELKIKDEINRLWEE